jgi:hypothetical protein
MRGDFIIPVIVVDVDDSVLWPGEVLLRMLTNVEPRNNDTFECMIARPGATLPESVVLMMAEQEEVVVCVLPIPEEELVSRSYDTSPAEVSLC